jgi:SAM-dependent methyltransferase
MQLGDIVTRRIPPAPWDEGDNIPWNEPGFSARMLKEHLSQRHDAASRRSETIERHVHWIHQSFLQNASGSILDLGCGPGLYTSRLAKLGHTCFGIDYSPASIAYARQQATEQSLACSYEGGDVRSVDFGAGHTLVMMIYGEINVFRRADALHILRKAWSSLATGGVLLLEPHTFEAIYRRGTATANWSSSPGGLFSETPHLVLTENFWHAEESIATTRYFVIDTETATTTRFAQSMQAYDLEAYVALISSAGFSIIGRWPSLTGIPDATADDFFALAARKT